jgi:hypothetical protein
MKVERLASAKHCSLLCPFISNKENEVAVVNTVTGPVLFGFVIHEKCQIFMVG